MIRSTSKRKYMSLKREKQAVSDGQEDVVKVSRHICTFCCKGFMTYMYVVKVS